MLIDIDNHTTYRITVTRETEAGENVFTYAVTGAHRVASERAMVKGSAKLGETVGFTAEAV
jgi:hypothetical protein